MLTYLDAQYPAPLATIPDPPPLLYVQGSLLETDRYAVAIVGTRKVSAAGRIVVEELARGLGEDGFYDRQWFGAWSRCGRASRGLAGKGRTLAVMGCGLIGPIRLTIGSCGRRLNRREPCCLNSRWGRHLPAITSAAHRIISGLSLGVVVTEAAIESGSLITARLANN